MVMKRPYYEHRNSPVRSKKKEGCQEEKTALKLGVRKDRPPGHGGPDAKTRKTVDLFQKGGLPKGTEAALPIILRQNSRFGVGMKRPNHKRTYRQFVPKKRAGLLYGNSPQRQAMYHQS